MLSLKEVERRWGVVQKDWVDVGLACAACHAFFQLSDLLLIFGSIQEEDTQKRVVLCTQCGIELMERQSLAPTTCVLFVPRFRRDSPFDRLLPSERRRVAESFERLDALCVGLAKHVASNVWNGSLASEAVQVPGPKDLS